MQHHTKRLALFAGAFIALAACRHTPPPTAGNTPDGRYVSAGYAQRAQGYDWVMVTVSSQAGNRIAGLTATARGGVTVRSEVAMSVLDRGRLHISSLSVGIAERLVEEMTRYASERKQFGKPIIEHQLVMAMVADSYAEAAAGFDDATPS